MTQADIDILVQEGEGTTLEFKEALSRSFAREVVALANTIGGRILLGVRDDGIVVGIRDSNALRAQIQDIARNCDPPVRVRVRSVISSRPRVSFGLTCPPAPDSAIPRTSMQTSIVPGSSYRASAGHRMSRTCW